MANLGFPYVVKLVDLDDQTKRIKLEDPSAGVVFFIEPRLWPQMVTQGNTAYTQWHAGPGHDDSVSCTHKEFAEGRCGEMVCPNYYSRHRR